MNHLKRREMIKKQEMMHFLVEVLENGYDIRQSMKYLTTKYMKLEIKQLREIEITLRNFDYKNDSDYEEFISDINKILE